MAIRTTSAARSGALLVGLAMVAVALAGCDSGQSGDSTTTPAPTTTTSIVTTTTATTTTTTTAAPTTTTTLAPLAPETVADYLLIVFRSARDSGVNEATGALFTAPSDEAYEAVLNALRSNFTQLARVVPPAEAERYHGLIVDQAAGALALYEELIMAIDAGDNARIEELAGESLRSMSDFAEIGEMQRELLEMALGDRSDTIASYVLEVSALGTKLSSDIEGFVDRLDEVLAGEQDLELLAEVAEEEAALLLALADEFGGLHPPQSGAEYHAAQMRAAGGVGGALTRLVGAIRDEDFEAFQASFQSMLGFLASTTSALDAQQDLYIAALEGELEENGGISWARVPVEDGNAFGIAQDVAAGDRGLVVFGSTRFESRDGVSWFPAEISTDLSTTMAAGRWVDDVFIAVGSVRTDASRDAAVWRSEDGHSWERLGEGSLAAEGDEAMTDVAAGPDGFVATGYAGDFTGDEPPVGAIWRSSDLERWQRVDFAGGADNPDGLRAVAHGANRFVTVGSGLWTSVDGQEWVRVSIADLESLSTVRYTGAGFVALGFGSDETVLVLRSLDGETWTRSGADQLPEGIALLRDVVGLDDRLYAVGSGSQGLVVWESKDAVSWTLVALPGGGFADFAAPVAVTSGGPGLVIVGSGPGGTTAWLGFVP